MTETMQSRCDRLDLYIAEGRLLRRMWRRTDEGGRELACLLAALAPEVVVDGGGDKRRCPADVMPAWLAHMTPDIDDCVSDDAWPSVIRRYATLARRWHTLDVASWRRAEYRVREACVREAMRHSTDDETLAVCEVVAGLCARVVAGDEPKGEDWADAEGAAEAWADAVDGVDAAADSAGAAVEAAAQGAADAADEAAAAAREAAAQAAPQAAWGSPAAAASAAAGDRIATATLDALEVEIERKQLEERA